MTFSVWNEKPPFKESDLGRGERIYQVGDKWCVTDEPEPTPERVADVLTAAAAPQRLTAQQKLTAFLDANPDVLTLIGDSK